MVCFNIKTYPGGLKKKKKKKKASQGVRKGSKCLQNDIDASIGIELSSFIEVLTQVL